jgi:hypothetical protein
MQDELPDFSASGFGCLSEELVTRPEQVALSQV